MIYYERLQDYPGSPKEKILSADYLRSELKINPADHLLYFKRYIIPPGVSSMVGPEGEKANLAYTSPLYELSYINLVNRGFIISDILYTLQILNSNDSISKIFWESESKTFTIYTVKGYIIKYCPELSIQQDLLISLAKHLATDSAFRKTWVDQIADAFMNEFFKIKKYSPERQIANNAAENFINNLIEI